MAEAARKPQPTPDSAREPSPLERLLMSLVSNARHNVSVMLAGTQDARRWPELDASIDQAIAGDAVVATTRVAHICRTAERLLQRKDASGQRRDSYAGMVADLERHAENGLLSLPADLVARRLHAALLWYTAWHLLAAGYPMRRILGVLNASRARRQPTLRLPALPWRQAITLGGNLAKRSAASIKAARDARAERAATAAAAAELLRTQAEAAKAAQRAAQVAKAATPPKPEPPALGPAAIKDAHSTVPAVVMPLDGQQLRRSVIGTWLMLVVLSWVSLFWGALISMPFGIGIGIAAMASVGIVVVPLWGTIWGFLGMGAARSSTLQRMGYKPALPGSFVVETTERYSTALGIPTPQVGTIPVFNAFAMGSSCYDATIAIGEPLTERLTSTELAAVIGHELGHVVSGDMRRMMLMRTFQNATVWFTLAQGLKQIARWIICWAAELAILAFSRRREYWADAIGASLAGKEAMIGALRKLDAAPALTSDENTHARFMFRALGSTHPTSADRIRALEEDTYICRLPHQVSRK